MPRTAVTVVVAGALALGLAAPAHGAFFCVNRPDSRCTAGTTFDKADLALALTQAAGTPADDTMLVGPGTYTGVFTYVPGPPGNAVTITGAGRDATRLVSPGGPSGPALTMADATVTDLTVEAANNSPAILAPPIPLPAGLQRVRVTRSDAAAGATAGVLVISGDTGSSLYPSVSLKDVGVDSPAAEPAIGLSTGANLQATDVRVSMTNPTSAGVALDSPGTVVLRRLRMQVGRVGVAVGGTTPVPPRLEDSLLLGAGTVPSIGAGTDGTSGLGTATLNVDHVLVAGFAQGLYAQAGGTAHATLNAANTVVQDASVAGMAAQADDAGAAATVTAKSSLVQGPHVAAGVGTHVVSYDASNLPAGTDPQLLGPDDPRPAAASPLRDKGAAITGAATTDYLGRPRVVGAAEDIGPVEYQGAAPTLTAAVDKPPVVIGTSQTFAASGKDDVDGDAVTVSWSFDDGTVVPGGGAALTVDHTFLTAGHHTATATATDAGGQSSTKTVAVDIACPPFGCPPSPAAAPTSPPVTTPKPTGSTLAQVTQGTDTLQVSVPKACVPKARTGLTVMFAIRAKKPGGKAKTKLAQVAYLIDGRVVKTDRLAPFSNKLSTLTLKSGSHRLLVKARVKVKRGRRAPTRTIATAFAVC